MINHGRQNLDLIEKFEKNTLFFPDKTALIFPRKIKGKKIIYERISYKELDNYSSIFAGYLRERGIKKGDKVIVMLPMSTMLYVLIFSLIKTGAV